MATLAWVLGIFGALCAVMGIITVAEVTVPGLGSAFTGTFWLQMAMVLFLACIASAMGAGRAE